MPRVTVSCNGQESGVDYAVAPSAPLPLLGMSAPANLWAQRKAQVEATGGRLQARRIFRTSLTQSLSLVDDAIDEGLVPVVSLKVNNDWAGVARGDYDAQLDALAEALAAKPADRIAVCLHHEPDKQSDPPDRGEGGFAWDFAGMYRRAIARLGQASNVEVAAIMNGWWWTNRQAALTDAEIDVWLPADVRSQIIIAADDYSPQGGEPSVVKTQNRVDWAYRMGDVQRLGVGEFNGYEPSDLTDLCDLVRTEPLFRGGWALVWNSDGADYDPLDQTGLLDDFQEILRTWPR